MSDKSEINLGFLYIEVFRVTLSQPLSINFVVLEISFMPPNLTERGTKQLSAISLIDSMLNCLSFLLALYQPY